MSFNTSVTYSPHPAPDTPSTVAMSGKCPHGVKLVRNSFMGLGGAKLVECKHCTAQMELEKMERTIKLKMEAENHALQVKKEELALKNSMGINNFESLKSGDFTSGSMNGADEESMIDLRNFNIKLPAEGPATSPPTRPSTASSRKQNSPYKILYQTSEVSLCVKNVWIDSSSLSDDYIALAYKNALNFHDGIEVNERLTIQDGKNKKFRNTLTNEKVTFRFNDDKDWCNLFAAISNHTADPILLFPNDITLGQFAVNLRPLWSSAITKEFKLREWMFAIANSDEQSIASDIMKQAFSKYLSTNIDMALTKEDCPVFLDFLIEIVEGQSMFILFFCFEYDANFLMDFMKEKASNNPHHKVYKKLLSMLRTEVDNTNSCWRTNEKLAVCLLNHPAYKEELSNDFSLCHPQFIDWYKNTLSKYLERQLMSWESFKLFLNDHKYCAYSMLKHSIEVHSKGFCMEALDKCVPTEFIIEEFDLSIQTSRPSSSSIVDELPIVGFHFLFLLFHRNMRSQTHELMQIFKNKKVFRDKVVKKLFEIAIIPARIDIASVMVEELLFDRNGLVWDSIAICPTVIDHLVGPLQAQLMQNNQRLVFSEDTRMLMLRLIAFEIIKYDRSNTNHIGTIGKKVVKSAEQCREILNMIDMIRFPEFLKRQVVQAVRRYKSVSGTLNEWVENHILDINEGSEEDIFIVKTVLDAVYGYLVMYYEATRTTDSSKLLSGFFSEASVSKDFFDNLFSPRQYLRNRVVHYLHYNRFKFRHIFEQSINEGKLLTRVEHMDVNVLRCLAMDAPNVSDEFSHNLTIAALHIEEFDGLEPKLKHFYEDSGKLRERANQLELIAKRVLQRPAADFTGVNRITLADLVACAQYAADALKILSYMPSGDGCERLQQMFNLYLTQNPPGSWKPMFKSAETIAFFIKYLDRENLDKCYEQFEKRNKDVTDYNFNDIMRTVKRNYPEPLVKPADVSFTSASAIDTFIANLLTSASSTRKTPVMKILTEICARWMMNRNEIVKIPMAPRNTQMVLSMFIIELASKLPAGKKSIIAQVGTGEGKSLIIAMLAIYFVKVKGRKVHILENNIGLLQRDYNSFKKFYAQFGISCADCLGYTSDIEKFASNDVCYCVRRAMEVCYREERIKGKEPFSNVVLIVDEVDELIVDDEVNQSYVMVSESHSLLVKEYFDIFKRDKSSAKPPNSENFNDKVWASCREAYNTSLKKTEGNGPGNYQMINGEYCANDERGRVMANTYHLWLEYVRYSRQTGYEPRIQYRYYYQSMPYMMSQYTLIVGLSGSLGSPSEKSFLNDAYGTCNVYVPPFLDTCNDVCKETLKLIDDRINVCNTREDQFNKVIATSLRLRNDVPVLIIMKNPKEVQDLHALLMQRGVSADSMQLFLEYHKGKLMTSSWDEIVEKATRPVGDTNQFRITITDYWGGRGHDYRINDNEVNDKGGMAIIMTTFPDSEREWIQWKGRSGRNDRRGQYSVFLLRSEIINESFAASFETHKISDTTYAVDVIKILSEAGDAKIKVKIDEKATEVTTGRRMNRLCDDFYKKYRNLNRQEFPASADDEKLKDFLASGRYDKNSVIEFYVSAGLIKKASDYVD